MDGVIESTVLSSSLKGIPGHIILGFIERYDAFDYKSCF